MINQTSPFFPLLISAAGGKFLNGFWKRKHPEGGEGAEVPEKERDRRVMAAFCGGMDRREGGEKMGEEGVGEEGAINLVMRVTEVLQGPGSCFPL